MLALHERSLQSLRNLGDYRSACESRLGRRKKTAEVGNSNPARSNRSSTWRHVHKVVASAGLRYTSSLASIAQVLKRDIRQNQLRRYVHMANVRCLRKQVKSFDLLCLQEECL